MRRKRKLINEVGSGVLRFILILAEDLGWDEQGRDCSYLCAETVDYFRKSEAISQDIGEVQSLFSEISIFRSVAHCRILKWVVSYSLQDSTICMA